jgi:hypothetical protein
MEDVDLRSAARASLRHLRPPARIPGYEQEEFLGRGAFGEVWKAVDANSGRAVAIKFYSRRGGLDWSHMTREVEKLQHLFSDRYVVQLFGVGWDSDPPYYVMEYMPYGSLEDRLQRGSLGIADAVTMIEETARGLVHAHDKGILHCDLKPGNIMLDQDDRPRLADFGQARLKHDRAPSLGTLFYMAPEQADLSAAPDARWDVYALGTILYRMVTGKLPYLTDEAAASVSSGTSIDERLRLYRETLQNSPPPALHRHMRGVDRALAVIIDRCLAVDPKRRYRNVQSVLTALDTRRAHRAQRSLLLVGIFGPALVFLVMAIFSLMTFRRTLSTAENQLVARTLESDQFAAKSVAAQFGEGLDKRRRMLEQDAADPDVRAWLSRPAPSSVSDLRRWLAERHGARNAEFTPETAASYWFILDVEGRVRGISPHDEALVGKYFGFREYFHGQGRELSPDDPLPRPITAWHRSNVFRSRPTNKAAVAFSTPIFADDRQDRVVGILATETELGRFSEFAGSRNQFAVLIDLRPDAGGKPGLIVEHPDFKRRLGAGHPLEDFYVPAERVEAFRRLRDRRAAIGSPRSLPAEETSFALLRDYHDPVEGRPEEAWLAAAEPIFLSRGPEPPEDTGWVIVVQETRADMLEPFVQVRSLVIRGAWTAAALVVLVVAALWGVVVLIVNPPSWWRNSRFLRTWTGTTTSQTGSSFGSRWSEHSVNSSDKK